MILTVLLIVCGFCVTLVISADSVVREESRFRHLVLFFQSFRIPVAVIAAVLAVISAIASSPDYPLLTWIIVLVNSFIAVSDVVLERFNVPEGPFRNLVGFLSSQKKYFAIAGFVILTVKTTYLLAPVLKLIL